MTPIETPKDYTIRKYLNMLVKIAKNPSDNIKHANERIEAIKEIIISLKQNENN